MTADYGRLRQNRKVIQFNSVMSTSTNSFHFGLFTFCTADTTHIFYKQILLTLHADSFTHKISIYSFKYRRLIAYALHCSLEVFPVINLFQSTQIAQSRWQCTRKNVNFPKSFMTFILAYYYWTHTHTHTHTHIYSKYWHLEHLLTRFKWLLGGPISTASLSPVASLQSAPKRPIAGQIGPYGLLQLTVVM